MPFVRRARTEDARAIHEAHMRSIQTLCSKDYSEAEIQAWGHRDFHEDQRINAILNHAVWVVEANNSVEGYGHLIVEHEGEVPLAHIMALYMTPLTAGQGFGFEIVQRMICEARLAGVSEIRLNSTISAYKFYKSVGFKDSGPTKHIEINGAGILCYPMSLEIEPEP